MPECELYWHNLRNLDLPPERGFSARASRFAPTPEGTTTTATDCAASLLPPRAEAGSARLLGALRLAEGLSSTGVFKLLLPSVARTSNRVHNGAGTSWFLACFGCLAKYSFAMVAPPTSASQTRKSSRISITVAVVLASRNV